MKTKVILTAVGVIFVLVVIGVFAGSHNAEIAGEQDVVAGASSSMATVVTAGARPQVPASPNRNIGAFAIRVITVNLPETFTPFSSEQLNDIDPAMRKLKTFVTQSSYGKTTIEWKKSGVYDLGAGICDRPTYGEKVDELIGRALNAADKETPLSDYGFFIIYRPAPSCADQVAWTLEGRGDFRVYMVNGREVHLRGIHISDLSEHYLFHEFGHSLGYVETIGHPSYFSCPITQGNKETLIKLSSTCSYKYDFSAGILPSFSIMSGKPGNLSDYSVIHKEMMGWLDASQIKVMRSSGTAVLTPVESKDRGIKAAVIPVSKTISGAEIGDSVYVSYRLPSVVSDIRPSGVILEIYRSLGTVEFLPTNAKKLDMPLVVGVPYRLGNNGPTVTLKSISAGKASISVEFNKVI